MAIDWGIVQQGYNRELLVKWVATQTSSSEINVSEVIVDTIEAIVRRDDAITIHNSTYMAMLANSILKKIQPSDSTEQETKRETENDD